VTPDRVVPETATRDHGARPPARRLLAAVCAALLGGAAALEEAARLAWFTAGVDAVGRGTVRVTATGADLVPALTAVATLGVAAVAAAVALGGAARRLLGVLVAVAGTWVGVAVGGLLLAPPAPADLAALPGAPAGGTALAGSIALRPGPLPALIGALLLVAAGIVLAVAEGGLPRLGSRFAARPVSSSTSAEPAAAGRRDADPDRAAWDALDAGRDPTAEPPAAEAGPTRRTRTDDGVSGRAD
jgi:uncharacterized membrane protein (TIGR02234 family)